MITDWHEEGKPVVVPRPAAPKPINIRPAPAPPQTVSLKKINEEKNNQRKPDAKHVSALRDALKAVVGHRPTTNNLQPTTIPKPVPSPKPLEPSPEELKKILDVQ